MGNLTSYGGMQNASGDAQLPATQPLNTTITTAPDSEYLKFPTSKDQNRLLDYEYFNNLLLGQHFEAFNIRINSADYSKNYSKLRYVAVNFAGLISKISADMLFSEPLRVKVDDDGDQDFIDALWLDNKMNVQLYESAINNSALGDSLFKIRIGKRTPNAEQATVIIEEFTPTIYFPEINGFNVKAEPTRITLGWIFKIGQNQYCRQEVHTPGKIEYHVYLMNGEKLAAEENLDILGDPNLTGIGMSQDTEIDDYLIVHIPNWKVGNRHFGLSDYYDIDKLIYALNNRITKVDNILDKHSDPILMVPDGVLDENGKVKKEQLHMIEVPEGNGAKQKPEYIVWNANLEAAFSQIEKLLDFFMMTAEITPDILGMGTGMSDSGRALKFKLMRTIAKSLRKKLYYDQAIKQILYVSQCFAKAHNIGVGDDYIKLKGDPTQVNLIWQDGLPIDDYEQVTNEVSKIDAGIQSKKEAIMNLDNLDEEGAEEKLEQIDEENKLNIQNSQMAAADFADKMNGTQADTAPDVKPEMKTNTPPVNKKSNGTQPQRTNK